MLPVVNASNKDTDEVGHSVKHNLYVKVLILQFISDRQLHLDPINWIRIIHMLKVNKCV